MNLDRQLNLKFYSRVGRSDFHLPVISTLLDEASRSILEIEVAGTLDEPRINNTAFPELDETLERLFPEPPAARRPARLARPPRSLDPRSFFRRR